MRSRQFEAHVASEINCRSRADASAATIWHTSSLLSSFYVVSLLEIVGNFRHYTSLAISGQSICVRRAAQYSNVGQEVGCLVMLAVACG